MGHSQLYRTPGTGRLPTPGHLTHVFESAMEEFICKDEAFVEDWLILSSMQLERDQEAKIAAKGVLDIT